MQLVLVAHRRGAALQVRHVRVVVGHNERALKLARVARVYAEVGAKLHGAAHALGNVDERAVAEHRTVERGVEVVAVGHNRPQILAHQVGVVLHCVAYRAEYDALLGQLLLEGGLHRHRVHYGVDRRSAQRQPLFQRNAQLVEGLHQFGVNLLLLRLGLLGQRVGIVRYGLVVNLRQMHVSPRGLLHREPVAESLQAEVEHPFRLALLGRNEPHDVLVQSSVDYLCVYVGGEAELVFLFGHAAHKLVFAVLVVH